MPRREKEVAKFLPGASKTIKHLVLGQKKHSFGTENLGFSMGFWGRWYWLG